MGDKRTDSGQFYPGGRVIARPGTAPQQVVVQWSDVLNKPQVAPLPKRYRDSDMKNKINEIASKFATAIAVALIGWTALAGLVVQKAQKDQIWNDEEIVTNAYLTGENTSGAARILPKYLWLYEANDSYPDEAQEYYRSRGDGKVDGGCSAVRDGGFLCRNFDFPFDDRAEFVVKMSAGPGRFASVGVAQVGTNLTERMVTSGSPEFSRRYKWLPGATVDGINENGVVAEINVVDTPVTGWHTTGDLHPLAAVRWILDNATNAQSAAEYIAANIRFPQGWEQNFHYMIADAERTFIVENGTATDGDEYHEPDEPVTMTNFQLSKFPWDGMGMERFGLLLRGASITNAWYTNAYRRETNPPWVSDLRDVLAYTNEIFTAWATHPKEYFRGKTNGGEPWWQTVHTSVYDITNRVLGVAVQETDDWYVFSLAKKFVETDPTVPAWAKQPTPPEGMTANALVWTNNAVKTKDGAKKIGAGDVGAYTKSQVDDVVALSVKSNNLGEAQVKTIRFVDSGKVRAVYGSGSSVFSLDSGISSWSAFGGELWGTPYNSLAIGPGAKAQGNSGRSVAVGSTSEANGQGSTAVGVSSKAKTIYSTAIGSQAVATGIQGTAIGYNAEADGDYSTAIGVSAEATGEHSTALGYGVNASGSSSIAIGYGAVANYGNSFVASSEPMSSFRANTINFGFTDDPTMIFFKGKRLAQIIEEWAPAAGNYDVVSNAAMNAVQLVDDVNGMLTAVTVGARGLGDVGTSSLANGGAVIASGAFSHAEGIETVSSGACAHAEGLYSCATGTYSHAEGVSSCAGGDGSHAEGQNTTADGEYSHAEGMATAAYGDGAHAEGFGSRAYGDYSHAEGFQAFTRDLDGTPDAYAFAWQGVSDGSPYNSHGEGSFNVNPVDGLYGFWIGDATMFTHIERVVNGMNGLFGGTASGRSAMAFGTYSTASNANALAIGENARAVSDSDYGSVAIGRYAMSSDRAIAVGQMSKANFLSTAVGPGTHADGEEASSFGVGSYASGYSSVAIGNSASASNDYSLVMSDMETGSHGKRTINFGFTDDPSRIYFKEKTLRDIISEYVRGRTGILTPGTVTAEGIFNVLDGEELTYIRAYGIQHIDTGYTLLKNDVVEAVMFVEMTQPSGVSWPLLFGSANGDTTPKSWYWVAPNNGGGGNNLMVRYKRNGTPVLGNLTTDTNSFYQRQVEIRCEGTKMMWKPKGAESWTETLTASSVAGDCDRSMFIFNSNDHDGGDYHSTARVYSFKITSGGRVVRDFVPFRIRGEAGLLDRVTGKFYRNAGTGKFNEGPVVKR